MQRPPSEGGRLARVTGGAQAAVLSSAEPRKEQYDAGILGPQK